MSSALFLLQNQEEVIQITREYWNNELISTCRRFIHKQVTCLVDIITIDAVIGIDLLWDSTLMIF